MNKKVKTVKWAYSYASSFVKLSSGFELNANFCKHAYIDSVAYGNLPIGSNKKRQLWMNNSFWRYFCQKQSIWLAENTTT